MSKDAQRKLRQFPCRHNASFLTILIFSAISGYIYYNELKQNIFLAGPGSVLCSAAVPGAVDRPRGGGQVPEPAAAVQGPDAAGTQPACPGPAHQRGRCSRAIQHSLQRCYSYGPVSIASTLF